MTFGEPAHARPEHAPGQRGKLLVVDDDLCVREAMGMYLSENGYACTTSGNAIAALDQLEREGFDLVITDLHMPEMDGMALLEWVKTHCPKTKVIIITGDMDAGAQSQALNNGVDSYLMKPFTLDHLLREVDGCLGRNGYRPGVAINPEGLRPTSAPG